MNEAALRLWCEAMARESTVERIGQPGHPPYLDRYYLAGWRPGVGERIPALYLHHFLGSDPAHEVHSHPWSAISVVLVGVYREHRCLPSGEPVVREYHAGDINVLAVETRHRIELVTADAWTLLLRSPVRQGWTFHPACD